MKPGMLNQRSRTPGLTIGVATEISPMPMTTTTGQAALAPITTARRCSAPSVLMISQLAPSSR